MSKGWIGVDLDGTLAYYDHWRGEDHIGDPVPAMVNRVKQWIAEGQEVRIFTARASTLGRSSARHSENIRLIHAWTLRHIGQILEVTSDKDYSCIAIWDDRAVQVVPNKGIAIGADIEGRATEVGRHFCSAMPCSPSDCTGTPCRYLSDAIANRNNRTEAMLQEAAARGRMNGSGIRLQLHGCE